MNGVQELVMFALLALVGVMWWHGRSSSNAPAVATSPQGSIPADTYVPGHGRFPS
jgi:hypothetical protein